MSVGLFPVGLAPVGSPHEVAAIAGAHLATGLSTESCESPLAAIRTRVSSGAGIENSTAQQLHGSLRVSVQQSYELNAALSLGAGAIKIPVSVAIDANAAFPLGGVMAAPLAAAGELQLPLNPGLKLRVRASQAANVDAAEVLLARTIGSQGPANESSFCLGLVVVAKRVVGLSGSLESALPAGDPVGLNVPADRVLTVAKDARVHLVDLHERRLLIGEDRRALRI